MTSLSGTTRTVVLVDGEHYPPVVRAAIGELETRGHDVVGAAFLGGTEKLSPDGTSDLGVLEATRGESPLEAFLAALDRWLPETVVDISGPPVVDARERMLLAAHALHRGIRYEGADFVFDPPPRPRLGKKPSIGVVGAAKRSGKTALSAHLARLLRDHGRSSVIVAMGRGGPADPELVEGAEDLTPEVLLELARRGRHAASDHLEDALVAGVVTIGTRRAGDGLAGAPMSSSFAQGVAVANDRLEELLVFEGSGSAVPPVHADAIVCVVPATADPEVVAGYLGPYRLLLADLVVVTLSEQPPSQAVTALEDRIRELVPGTPLVHSTFRPCPLEPVSGRSVFFATTAPPEVAGLLVRYLEAEHGARVVGWSNNLANRQLLIDDLRAIRGAEVLVTELKAAAVDVATRVAIDADMHVVYCDNRPVTTGGDGPLDGLLLATVDAAVERFEEQHDD